MVPHNAHKFWQIDCLVYYKLTGNSEEISYIIYISCSSNLHVVEYYFYLSEHEHETEINT